MTQVAKPTNLSALTKKRLLRLADRLDKVKPSHFDIHTWYGINSDTAIKKFCSLGFGKVKEIGKKTEEVSDYTGGFVTKKVKKSRYALLDEGFCGSVACVLGHAAMVPEFNRAGLYVEVTGLQEKIEEGRAYWGGEGGIAYRDPKKPKSKLYESFEAGMKFFGVPEAHAVLMFGGEYSRQFYGFDLCNDNHANITPKRVAKYLRKYVESNGQYADDVMAMCGVTELKILC